MATSKKKTTKASPPLDTLLFHAMYLMAVIDGETTQPELQVVKGLLTSIPEFAESSVSKLVADSRALSKAAGGPIESITVFLEIKAKPQRLKCFLLAAELAYASGGIGKAEAALLSSLAKILRLEAATTRSIVKVLGMKYV